MAKIIKHHQVDVAGRFQLQHPNGSPATVKAPEMEAGKEAQVRVLETDDQMSVLEVTCPCGHVILIRCEHE